MFWSNIRWHHLSPQAICFSRRSCTFFQGLSLFGEVLWFNQRVVLYYHLFLFVWKTKWWKCDLISLLCDFALQGLLYREVVKAAGQGFDGVMVWWSLILGKFHRDQTGAEKSPQMVEKVREFCWKWPFFQVLELRCYAWVVCPDLYAP